MSDWSDGLSFLGDSGGSGMDVSQLYGMDPTQLAAMGIDPTAVYGPSGMPGGGGASFPSFSMGSGQTSNSGGGTNWGSMLAGAGMLAAPILGYASGQQAAGNIQQAADTQAQHNQDLARQQNLLNNPNVQSPYGNQSWTVGPDGRPTVTQTLAPGQQSLLDARTNLGIGQLGAANEMLPNITNMMKQPFG